MGSFLDSEKKRQALFKKTSPYFSEPARRDGQYRGREYPFFLPEPEANENLYTGTRESALQYFADEGIQWNQGLHGKPSQHLCSSQICCVNFLYPFTDNPNALR